MTKKPVSAWSWARTRREFERGNAPPLFILGVVVVIVVGVYVSLLLDKRADEPDEITAMVMAEAFVKKRLLSPGTAKFPTYQKQYVRRLGGDRWRVSAYVDAQNALGGTLRRNWVCELTYVGNDEWQCDSCKIDD